MGMRAKQLRTLPGKLGWVSYERLGERGALSLLLGGRYTQTEQAAARATGQAKTQTE